MNFYDIKKPTISIVYDSILEIYPRLNKQNLDNYNCYRKVIIEEISNSYDGEKIFIQKILSRIINEC